MGTMGKMQMEKWIFTREKMNVDSHLREPGCCRIPFLVALKMVNCISRLNLRLLLLSTRKEEVKIAIPAFVRGKVRDSGNYKRR